MAMYARAGVVYALSVRVRWSLLMKDVFALNDLLSFPWFRGGGKGREGREDAGLILDSHFALTQFRSESNLFQMGV